jgi:hypothetical protein
MESISINLTSGATVLIPDSNTKISSYQENVITVPAVANESSGTSIKRFAQILESNFANHIHDLTSEPIMVTASWNSGTSEDIKIYAKKRGKSEHGMSPWYVHTSNKWEIRIPEAVLEKSPDLNQCIEALVIKSVGGNFKLGTTDFAIKRSIETLQCLRN